MVYYDYKNPDYIKCCNIIEKLDELDCNALVNLAISLVANYPETRDFVIGQYQEILIEDDLPKNGPLWQEMRNRR